MEETDNLGTPSPSGALGNVATPGTASATTGTDPAVDSPRGGDATTGPTGGARGISLTQGGTGGASLPSETQTPEEPEPPLPQRSASIGAETFKSLGGEDTFLIKLVPWERSKRWLNSESEFNPETQNAVGLAPDRGTTSVENNDGSTKVNSK